MVQDGAMYAATVCFLAASAAYAGFQWTVHVVVYRQFSAVPADAFPQYEALHQRRISVVVGPLFALLVLSTGWLLVDRPAGIALWLPLLAAGLVAVILGMTALAAVPQHRRLSGGWNDGAYRSLLRADLVRTLAATAAVGVAVVIILG